MLMRRVKLRNFLYGRVAAVVLTIAIGAVAGIPISGAKAASSSPTTVQQTVGANAADGGVSRATASGIETAPSGNGIRFAMAWRAIVSETSNANERDASRHPAPRGPYVASGGSDAPPAPVRPPGG
jgi:hypothetical protein